MDTQHLNGKKNNKHMKILYICLIIFFTLQFFAVVFCFAQCNLSAKRDKQIEQLFKNRDSNKKS